MNEDQALQVLTQYLTVCRHSGYRGRGIQKRIQENENFLMCVEEAREVLRACPWFGDAVRSVGKFFQEIHSLVHTSSASDMDGFLKGVINICGEYGQHLRTVQNTDRLLLILIKNVPCINDKIGFSESWIEDDELFFEDFRYASKHLFKPTMRPEIFYPWVGRTYKHFLLFNPG